MKIHTLLIPFLFLQLPGYGQDMLYTQRGDSIRCQVQEVTPKTVRFVYPGETVQNVYSNNQVSRIRFASGRVQDISAHILIGNPGDWENVILTTNPADIEGLRRVGEFIGTVTPHTFDNPLLAKSIQRAQDDIKQAAAARGCHVVFIMSTSNIQNYPVITGVGYGY